MGFSSIVLKYRRVHTKSKESSQSVTLRDKYELTVSLALGHNIKITIRAGKTNTTRSTKSWRSFLKEQQSRHMAIRYRDTSQYHDILTMILNSGALFWPPILSWPIATKSTLSLLKYWYSFAILCHRFTTHLVLIVSRYFTNDTDSIAILTQIVLCWFAPKLSQYFADDRQKHRTLAIQRTSQYLDTITIP